MNFYLLVNSAHLIRAIFQFQLPCYNLLSLIISTGPAAGADHNGNGYYNLDDTKINVKIIHLSAEPTTTSMIIKEVTFLLDYPAGQNTTHRIIRFRKITYAVHATF